jgi:hypothetical protein
LAAGSGSMGAAAQSIERFQDRAAFARNTSGILKSELGRVYFKLVTKGADLRWQHLIAVCELFHHRIWRNCSAWNWVLKIHQRATASDSGQLSVAAT